MCHYLDNGAAYKKKFYYKIVRLDEISNFAKYTNLLSSPPLKLHI